MLGGSSHVGKKYLGAKFEPLSPIFYPGGTEHKGSTSHGHLPLFALNVSNDQAVPQVVFEGSMDS